VSSKPNLRLPVINIDGVPSQRRYLKRSQSVFEVVEGDYVQLTKRGIRLKVVPKRREIVVTRSESEDEEEGDGEKYGVESLPKQYRFLYLYSHRILDKMRKRVTQYTMVRVRKLDPDDRTICCVSLTGSYTLYLPDHKVAFLKTADSDIEFRSRRDSRTIEFRYDPDRVEAVKFDDAFDGLRVIVHECIRGVAIIEQQRAKKLSHSAKWTVEYNVDSGSVTELKADDAVQTGNCPHFSSSPHGSLAEEGAFRGHYESETTQSSDWSDNNLEISTSAAAVAAAKRGDEMEISNGPFLGKKFHCNLRAEQGLSTVESSTFATESTSKTIRSEASWRNLKGNGNDEDSGNLQDDRRPREELEGWSRRKVMDYLQHHTLTARGIGEAFWEHAVNGTVLATLDRKQIHAMFRAASSQNVHVEPHQIEAVVQIVAALQQKYSL